MDMSFAYYERTTIVYSFLSVSIDNLIFITYFIQKSINKITFKRGCPSGLRGAAATQPYELNAF